MKFQVKLITQLSVLGVLIIAALLGAFFSAANVQERLANQPLIPNLQTDQIAGVEINGTNDDIALTRIGGEWNLSKDGKTYPALENKVNALIKMVADLRKNVIATRSVDKWKDFEVDGELAKRMRFLKEDGSELVDIYIGKPSSGAEGTFVRLGGDPAVYNVASGFTYYAKSKFADWSDLRIFPENTEIIEFEMQGSLQLDEETTVETDYRLNQEITEEGVTWMWVSVPAGIDKATHVVQQSNVNSLVTSLTALSANEFATAGNMSESSIGLDNPNMMVRFSTADNKSYSFKISGPSAEDGMFYLKADNQDFIYKISRWNLERGIKDFSDLGYAPINEDEIDESEIRSNSFEEE